MSGLGPRKLTVAQAPQTRTELDSIQKDVQILSRQRGILGQMLRELLVGYTDVAKRVKASGDAKLSVTALNHLYRMSRMYRALASLSSVTPEEAESVNREASDIEMVLQSFDRTSSKIASLKSKLSKDFRVLQMMQQEIASMEDLKIDSDSFFKKVGRSEVMRREAKAKR